MLFRKDVSRGLKSIVDRWMVGFGLSVLLVLPACGFSKGCEHTNPILEKMEPGLVTFSREDGSTFSLEVKIADENDERAQGFQRICAEQIAAMPILFVFQFQVIPQFHMNNVVAPIDIAFIDRNGQIDTITAMQPYVIGALKKPKYAPKRRIMYALEVAPEFFATNNIDKKATMSWRPLEQETDT
ncbi:MAG: DUF192 domain-containing protein [Pseudomonadota bacterium]